MKQTLLLIFAAFVFCWQTNAQVAQDFESGVPPSGWTSFRGTNGLGTGFDWENNAVSTNTGSGAAYVRYENVTGGNAEDWLVTEQFTVDATINSAMLDFYQRQGFASDYGTSYTVRVSTASQSTHADFTVVDTQAEGDFSSIYTLKQVDLTAYDGMPIYVAFVMEQDDGDNWYIDDVLLPTPVPTCFVPTALGASSITGTSASLAWTTGGATAWEIVVQADGTGTPGGAGTMTSTNPYTAMGLTAATDYEFYVRDDCGGGDYSDWAGPFVFTTGCALPVPGNTVSTASVVCSGVDFDLSLQNATLGTGVTYQWQSSPDNSVWTDIGSATSAGLTTSQTAATYYRCNVTCSGEGTTASTGVEVTMDMPTNCYCTGTHATGGGADNIAGVVLGTLSNTGTGQDGYTYYDALTVPDLAQSTSSSSVAVTFGSDGNQYYAVYIDWDQNGDFDGPNETIVQVTSGNQAGSSSTENITITVPAGATLGQTRMRVRGGDDSPITDPCVFTNSSYGETEDYLVNVIAAPDCLAPTALTATSITSASSTLSWTTGGATAWEVVVQAAGTGTPGGSGTATGSNPYSATGLTAATDYEFYVRDFCNPDYSDWAGPFAFTTTCALPAPGNTITSASMVCSGVDFDLSLQNATLGAGVTYQWQSSPDNSVWTDIGSATSAGLTTSQTAATYYRCNVTCSGEGTTASTGVEVTMDMPTNCYCTGTHATGGGNDAVTGVVLGTLSNTGTGQDGYTYYDALTVPDLAQSTSSSSVAVTFGSDGNQYYAVYIDWDQNGDFDGPNETIVQVTSGNQAGSSSTENITITVPAGATLGQTRMRVRGGDDSPITDPCVFTNSSYGETEDYLVNVIAAPDCLAPTALTATSITSASSTLSWTTGGATAWEVVVQAAGTGTPGGSGTATGSNPYSATGLTAATDYEFYVRDFCNPDYSDWAGPFAFTTTCALPAPGNTITSASMVCSGVDFDLSLQNATLGAGVTYQWQSSPDNSTWTDIGSATNATLTTSQTAATYYRCNVMCSGEGTTASTAVQVTMDVPANCYCSVAYTNTVEPITLVNIGDINNTSSAATGGDDLEDFTGMSSDIYRDASYTITLKGNTDGGFTDYFRVFIDFNQDGDWDDTGEAFDCGTIFNSTGGDAIEATATIAIPATALLGNTIMRVTKLYDAYQTTACSGGGYGQSEDYTLNIIDGLDCGINQVHLEMDASTYTLDEPCDDASGWTYYSRPGVPGDYMFAIEWNPLALGGPHNDPAKAAATVTITLDAAITNAVNGTTEASYATARYWNVDLGAVPLDGPVNVKFFYEAADLAAVVAAAQAYATTNSLPYNGSMWFKTDGTAYDPTSDVTAADFSANVIILTAAAGTENGVDYVQFDGIDSFSGGGAAAGAGAGFLPVSLLSFDGKVMDKGNKVYWSTSEEENARSFVIERTSDTRAEWSPIGEVMAIGNSSDLQQYSFMDDAPIQSAYYRLKMMDFDGSYEYSYVIQLKRPSTGTISVYPVPSRDKVNVSFTAQRAATINVMISDLSGKLVYNQQLNAVRGLQTESLDIDQLAQGVYMLSVIIDGQRQIQRIVKN